jgi:beta-carotene/zeaxanthin 4-ketolase
MNSNHLRYNWTQPKYKGFTIALMVLFGWGASVSTGVLGLNPFAGLLMADVLWASLTMWLTIGLFITAHDAMHGLILPQHPRLNAWVGRLSLFLYAGLSYKRLLKGHMAHHAQPSEQEDPDYWPEWGVAWYFRFMLQYLTPMPIILVACTYHFLAHGVGLSIPRLIGMWIVPQIFSSAQLFYFGTYLPHRPGRPFEGTGLTKARSNKYSIGVSLLTCYHFGYHFEHHAAPYVPWWALPKLRKQIRECLNTPTGYSETECSKASKLCPNPKED